MKNKNQSQHLADLAHREFQWYLTYKSEKTGTLLVEDDRWFPSSRLCSNCLMYHPDLKLTDRIFCCPFCGLVIDRDYNAALNLEQYFYQFVLSQVISITPVAESSAETLNACGETVGPAF